MTSLAIIETLQALADERQGRLTPNLVVETARNPNSPLHSQFIWDDTVAANLQRIEAARRLIKGVHIETRTETKTVTSVAYVRDPDMPPQTQGYISIATLRNNQDAARETIIAEFSRAAAALQRARNIAAALDMTEEIDSVMTRLEMAQIAVVAATQRAD